MHLTASDLYPYFRPSECRLRVYLKARDEPEDDASPYEAVILRLGERHEASHLASLDAVVDLRGGTLVERAAATHHALHNHAPSILYHGVLTRAADIAGQACNIFGEPDFILMEPGSVVIRDWKYFAATELSLTFRTMAVMQHWLHWLAWSKRGCSPKSRTSRSAGRDVAIAGSTPGAGYARKSNVTWRWS